MSDDRHGAGWQRPTEPPSPGSRPIGSPPVEASRLDEAQHRLQEQSYGMIVLTSGPTPMSINDALGILLDRIRQNLVKLEEEAHSMEVIFETPRNVCPSRNYLDYLARLDFGFGDREGDPELYDALATLRMVVG